MDERADDGELEECQDVQHDGERVVGRRGGVHVDDRGEENGRGGLQFEEHEEEPADGDGEGEEEPVPSVHGSHGHGDQDTAVHPANGSGIDGL